ncbi:AMP-binding protein, partial [Achromobacter xylosoxidans]
MSHPQPLTRIHQLLARQAGSQPDAICLYEEGGGILTYAQLWQRARDAADWLAAAGVRPGHRVLMVGENCAAMIAALFGCGIIGAWPVGVNARLSAREIAAISAHAQPEVTLYTSGISAAAAAHAEAAAAQPAEAAAWGAGVHARRADAPTLPETGAPAAEVATVI